MVGLREDDGFLDQDWGTWGDRETDVGNHYSLNRPAYPDYSDGSPHSASDSSKF